MEYHGWLTINQSLDGENEEDVEQIVSEIGSFFKERSIVNENYQVSGANGHHFLHYSGSHNRNGDTLKRLLEILRFVASKAPGSYGILFFRDDEIEEYENEFQVYKLARGKIEFEKDNYLSPCIPVIED